MQPKTLIRLCLWIIALILLVITLSQLPLHHVITAIQSLNLMNWIIWLSLNAVIILLLTWRWHLLIHAFSASFSFLKLLSIRQAGQTVSFITPGPQFGGEPLQIYWLCKKGVPLSAAIFSLAVDRLLELMANFSILLLAALLLLSISHSNLVASNFATPNLQVPYIALITTGLFVCGVIFLLLRRPGWTSRQLKRLMSPWQHNEHIQKLGQQWKNIGHHWRVLLTERKKFLFTAILISLSGWAGLLAEIWLVLYFVGVNPDIYEFVFILLALRMALLLPIPGGVGTVEAAVLWSFTSLDLSIQSAISLIALIRLRDVILLLIGFYCLKVADKRLN
jgi:glycosyltransferase 2 family protein